MEGKLVDEQQQSMLDRVHELDAPTKPKQTFGSARDSTVQTTINGYAVPEVVSAMQKAIRRGQEERALYWASELMASEKTYYMWRRLIIIAAEDIGLGDPDMVMRIMLMKQAHDVGREWNIPFLAIFLLCRAPKNREADDAAYLYEVKRDDTGKYKQPQKWKLRVPPEARDGHTPAGRASLYQLAKQHGKDWFEMWGDEFYDDVALLEGYVPRGVLEGTHEPDDPEAFKSDVYRGRLMEWYGRGFRTYDIHTNTAPRIRSGGAAEQAETDELTKRVPSEVDMTPVMHDPSTGETLPSMYTDPPHVFKVQSFSDPDLYYVVDLRMLEGRETCTCPAFEKGGGGSCKHIVAVMNEMKGKL